MVCGTILRTHAKGALRFVSPILKHIVFPVLARSGYLRHISGTSPGKGAGAAPAVVTYHGVFPSGYKIVNAALDGNLVRADSLRQQLLLVKKHYHAITAEDFLHWLEGERPLPPRSILLTCDDALASTLTEMVPLLQELGLSCLFFATGASACACDDEPPSMLWYEELYLMLWEASGPIALSLPEAGVDVHAGPIAPGEKHPRWWKLVQELSRFDRKLRRGFLDRIREQLGLAQNWTERFVQDPVLAARFLTLDRVGLRQLAAAGMTVGAHSLSHPILAQAPEDVAQCEISESRSVLEEALGQAVWAFAYPFGNAATVTRRDLRLAEEAGFRCAFMNVGGGFGAQIERFAVPRVHVTADMSLAEFEAHLSGFYRDLRKKLRGSEEDLIRQ